jgi:hypothetical protein
VLRPHMDAADVAGPATADAMQQSQRTTPTVCSPSLEELPQQQPAHRGQPVTLWADTTVVHLLIRACGSRPCRPGSPPRTCGSCSPTVAEPPARHPCRPQWAP